MPDQFTETTSRSWGSRIKGAFGGIWRALHAEGCTLMLLPVDSRDILARIYLPESPDRPNVTQIQ